MTDTMVASQWVSKVVDEKRSIAYTNCEFRALDDGVGNTFTGYAAIWDSPSYPLPFIEYVRAGCFRKTLQENDDVHLLVDHIGVPLARTKSQTLSLVEDEIGLKATAVLDPANPDAARMISALGRGDVNQMSFAFRVLKDVWSSDRQKRELIECQLFDVSLVSSPAYENTTAEIRSATAAALAAAVVIPTGFSLLRKRQLELARYR